jgi:hypothetical protein
MRINGLVKNNPFFKIKLNNVNIYKCSENALINKKNKRVFKDLLEITKFKLSLTNTFVAYSSY